jgi:hypothetical protein
MSSQMPIFRAADLDISEINFTKPRKNKVGKMVSYMNYGQTGFMIETPTMHSFGVGAFKDEKKGFEGKHRLTFTRRVGGTEKEENVNNFFDFLKALDEKMIDFLIENSQLIFKESYTNDDRKVVASAYKKYRIVKEKKDEKTGEMYPPNFRAGFQTVDDVPQVQLLKGKTAIPINSFEDLEEHIPKNSSVRAVIQPSIYILSDIMGVRFTARFLKVPEVTRMTIPTVFRFSDEPDAEEPVQDDAAVAPVDMSEQQEAAEDSEEGEAEEEAEDEDEEEGEVEEEEEGEVEDEDEEEDEE